MILRTFLISRLSGDRGSCLGVDCLNFTFGHILFFPLFVLNSYPKVLCQWLMDQAPIGNKAPRPGYARQIWCPACRGLVANPLPLTSGHVLTECMVVEGASIGNSGFCSL